MIPAAVSEEYRCLVEILTCLVCKGLVTQAHICPNCSKFYCLPCIRRQLALEEKCLHCSKQLSPAALSNCEDLCCDLRETLEKVKLRASESARAPQDKSPYYCYVHKLEKTYYCQTCERPLCSDCSVLTEVVKLGPFSTADMISSSSPSSKATTRPRWRSSCTTSQPCANRQASRLSWREARPSPRALAGLKGLPSSRPI